MGQDTKRSLMKEKKQKGINKLKEMKGEWLGVKK